jgi:hypothetical protein
MAHLVASNGTLSVQVRTSILSEYIRMRSIEIGSIINNSRGREFLKAQTPVWMSHSNVGLIATLLPI